MVSWYSVHVSMIEGHKNFFVFLRDFNLACSMYAKVGMYSTTAKCNNVGFLASRKKTKYSSNPSLHNTNLWSKLIPSANVEVFIMLSCWKPQTEWKIWNDKMIKWIMWYGIYVTKTKLLLASWLEWHISDTLAPQEH